MTLLEIQNLSVALPRGADRPFAARDVSLSVAAGEVLCVVGESGSGKSLTAAAILGLLPPGVRATAGRILFEGTDLLPLLLAQLRGISGRRIGMVFQDPMTALNPLHTVGAQIAEVYRTHTTLGRAAIAARVQALLESLHLPEPRQIARAYPHELSGGQRQRCVIAMAIALEPRLLIADEPTTALDVTTQAQILGLIRELRARRGMGVLFITHDFGVVAEVATRIAVMRQGEVVEQGPAEAVLNHPRHAYTQALIAAMPALRPPPYRPSQAPAVLEVAGLNKTFRKRGRTVPALRDVSLRLPRGTTLGIVGESGSGKSTLARCLMKLMTPDSGAIRILGTDITRIGSAAWRSQTGRIQMVFQDPFTSLNPRRRAGDLVTQGLALRGVRGRDLRERAEDLFLLVGLDPASLDRFPHEFSGGQRQRIGLARALALEPDVLVADEPVSALDLSVQAQVLDLLAGLRRKLGLSMVFITHDLRVAAQVCDRVAIMQRGEVVEEGPAETLLTAPSHPYSQALLAAVPGRGWAAGRRAATPDLARIGTDHAG
ncbi:ABC transporter ATP-binding protein [Falsiroseomonas sp.]|uniref:ABC transporter ATP-binding protein n=1 Tax=Falsiroseomonas sp. TaxID=2870721 RepID=UPI003F729DD7